MCLCQILEVSRLTSGLSNSFDQDVTFLQQHHDIMTDQSASGALDRRNIINDQSSNNNSNNCKRNGISSPSHHYPLHAETTPQLGMSLNSNYD